MKLNFRTSALAILSFSLCAFLHADEAEQPPGSTLDAARKDLKTLPATEKSQELLGKSSGLGSAVLPTLALPGGNANGDAQASKPDPNAPASATWLQDAMNQTDAARAQRRSCPDAARERDQAGRGGTKTTPASDPLAPYLGQWLTPRDQELLRPDSRKTTDSTSSFKVPGESSSTAVSGSDRTSTPALQTDFLPVSPLEPAKNPYLSEPAPQIQQPNPFAPAAPAKALPGSVPVGQVTKPAAVKPAAKPVEAPAASPNASPVDDRKYFPQLRRF